MMSQQCLDSAHRRLCQEIQQGNLVHLIHTLCEPPLLSPTPKTFGPFLPSQTPDESARQALFTLADMAARRRSRAHRLQRAGKQLTSLLLSQIVKAHSSSVVREQAGKGRTSSFNPTSCEEKTQPSRRSRGKRGAGERRHFSPATCSRGQQGRPPTPQTHSKGNRQGEEEGNPPTCQPRKRKSASGGKDGRNESRRVKYQAHLALSASPL